MLASLKQLWRWKIDPICRLRAKAGCRESSSRGGTFYLEAETAIIWSWPAIDWAFMVNENQAAELRHLTLYWTSAPYRCWGRAKRMAFRPRSKTVRTWYSK